MVAQAVLSLAHPPIVMGRPQRRDRPHRAVVFWFCRSAIDDPPLIKACKPVPRMRR